jgi:hypothetical protein
MKAGRKVWMISGGHIPLATTGKEPEFTSRDVLSLLNINEQDAHVEITIYYTDKPPVGPYEVLLKNKRARQIRFNDLIDPEAVILDEDYAAIIVCDVPVVAQFTRMDTSQAALTGLTTIAYPEDVD